MFIDIVIFSMSNPLSDNANKLQMEFCLKNNFPYFQLDWNQKIGISKNFNPELFPINGLRHPITESSAGWYIWSGDEFSTESDFFEPIHAYHLIEKYPELIKYLGLPVGYRFLYDQKKNYEDIWKDESLLKI